MRSVLMAFFAFTACSAASPQNQSALPFTVTAKQNFNEPWAMAFLPGSGVAMTNAVLITEREGRLLYGKVGEAMSAVAGVPRVDAGGQGGLGDVIADPQWAANHLIYLSWVEAGAGDTRGAVVGRAKLILGEGTPRLEGLSIIWRQSPKVSGRGHFGHRLAFGADGKLYVSSGERQKFDPAQDLTGNLGKIIMMNADGSDAKMLTLGHRNPLGLAFDAEQRLWEIEMGPKGGDELNLIKAGANYGYPKASNGSHYDGRDIPDHRTGDGFAAPKVWWNPSISPGSLMIYSGDMFPKWKGDAFIGALGGEALIRIHLNGEQATKTDEWPMGARIREVEQGPDGAMWLLEDGGNGRLLKLTPKG
ncbi:MAG: PQQ-dependent sugar dehydrogenase [Sphingomonadaceae bacterium]